MPEFSNYGQYSSDNYGAHCLRFDLGTITVWFSYQTMIAFRVIGKEIVVHKNDLGTTTGKHLNWIDSGEKKKRVSSKDFKKLWEEQTKDNPALSF